MELGSLDFFLHGSALPDAFQPPAPGKLHVPRPLVCGKASLLVQAEGQKDELLVR